MRRVPHDRLATLTPPRRAPAVRTHDVLCVRAQDSVHPGGPVLRVAEPSPLRLQVLRDWRPALCRWHGKRQSGTARRPSVQRRPSSNAPPATPRTRDRACGAYARISSGPSTEARAQRPQPPNRRTMPWPNPTAPGGDPSRVSHPVRQRRLHHSRRDRPLPLLQRLRLRTLQPVQRVRVRARALSLTVLAHTQDNAMAWARTRAPKRFRATAPRRPPEA